VRSHLHSGVGLGGIADTQTTPAPGGGFPLVFWRTLFLVVHALPQFYPRRRPAGGSPVLLPASPPNKKKNSVKALSPKGAVCGSVRVGLARIVLVGGAFCWRGGVQLSDG